VTSQESAAKHGLAHWATREFEQLLVIVLYLWVIFGIYVLCETVVLAKQHVSLLFHGFAFINALVLSKVLLIAEDMNFADRLKTGPLIYPILYKALAFAVLLVAAHIGESMLVGLWHGKSAAESFPPIGGGTFQGFLCVVALMFVALIPFFAFREIGRVLGGARLSDLLFRSRSALDPRS
jgi:hypothetical protein